MEMNNLLMYDIATGQILQVSKIKPGTEPPEGFALPGTALMQIQGLVDAKTQRVSDDGTALVDKDATVVSAEETVRAWRDLRARRAGRLQRSVDSINAVRWDAMTQSERTAWTTYRQALLDLPANTTDPASPVWPAKPGDDT